jgi:hypothetical protein
MQQRQLRLGDILDDYCPRERRITNHAVVAMVGDQVKQTRCTTCEAEHEYKQAKMPASRKKKDAAAAPRPDVTGAAPEVVQVAPPPTPVANADIPKARQHEVKRAAVLAPSEPQLAPPAPPAVADAPIAAPEQAQPLAAAPAEDAGLQNGSEDEGPVHRRLIRATLPRQEGQITRPTPQFTMRQPAGRPVGFGGKPRGVGRAHTPGGRPQGAGGKGGRPANFSRGPGGGDAFGRGRVREGQPQPLSRHTRHASSGHPPRPGKKHSK